MAKMVSKERGSTFRPRSAAKAAATDDVQVTDDATRDERAQASRNDDLQESSSAELVETTDADDDIALAVSPGRSATLRRESDLAAHSPVANALSRYAITRYLYNSYLEMLKVTWPTSADARNMTIIVIVMSAVVAAVLGLADIGLVRALSWIVSLATPH